MNKIIDFFKNIISNSILSILNSFCSTVDSVFKYLLKRQEINEKKKNNKEIQKYNDSLKDICNDGNLKELLKIFSLSLLLIITGCHNNIEVITTNNWEGHYFTVQEFNENTKNIKLDKKESIWVLSNRTLYKILEKKQEK